MAEVEPMQVHTTPLDSGASLLRPITTECDAKWATKLNSAALPSESPTPNLSMPVDSVIRDMPPNALSPQTGQISMVEQTEQPKTPLTLTEFRGESWIAFNKMPNLPKISAPNAEAQAYQSPRFSGADADMYGFAPLEDNLFLVRCKYCTKVVEHSRFQRHLGHCLHFSENATKRQLQPYLAALSQTPRTTVAAEQPASVDPAPPSHTVPSTITKKKKNNPKNGASAATTKPSKKRKSTDKDPSGVPPKRAKLNGKASNSTHAAAESEDPAEPDSKPRQQSKKKSSTATAPSLAATKKHQRHKLADGANTNGVTAASAGDSSLSSPLCILDEEDAKLAAMIEEAARIVPAPLATRTFPRRNKLRPVLFGLSPLVGERQIIVFPTYTPGFSAVGSMAPASSTIPAGTDSQSTVAASVPSGSRLTVQTIQSVINASAAGPANTPSSLASTAPSSRPSRATAANKGTKKGERKTTRKPRGSTTSNAITTTVASAAAAATQTTTTSNIPLPGSAAANVSMPPSGTGVIIPPRPSAPTLEAAALSLGTLPSTFPPGSTGPSCIESGAAAPPLASIVRGTPTDLAGRLSSQFSRAAYLQSLTSAIGGTQLSPNVIVSPMGAKQSAPSPSGMPPPASMADPTRKSVEVRPFSQQNPLSALSTNGLATNNIKQLTNVLGLQNVKANGGAAVSGPPQAATTAQPISSALLGRGLASTFLTPATPPPAPTK